MDIGILQDIGLTGAEIKVFLALLELGSSSAGGVVKRSGLQNAVVHRAFHSLREKGLLTTTKIGRINQYQTIEPSDLLHFLDEKRAKLKTLLPELEAKRALAKTKPQARIYEGVRGVKELINLMIDTKSKQYFAYGGSHTAHEQIGPFFWEHFHGRRAKKKIKGQILFHTSLKYWANELNKRFLYTKVKTTRRDFEELTETIICGNRVAIILYLDKPFGFLIEERLAAKSYRKFFEILWKHS